jgi:hypothetical protein
MAGPPAFTRITVRTAPVGGAGGVQLLGTTGGAGLGDAGAGLGEVGDGDVGAGDGDAAPGLGGGTAGATPRLYTCSFGGRRDKGDCEVRARAAHVCMDSRDLGQVSCSASCSSYDL